MSENPYEFVTYKLRNAQVLTYPFPHFFVRDVFPADFYNQLLGSLPAEEVYQPLSGGYANREAAPGNLELMKPFEDFWFGMNVMQTFAKQFFQRYPNHDRPKFRQEWRFIRDSEGYKIGPHTDAPQKVVSLLFYLPIDFLDSDCGTGIYIPKDHVQTCEGGPHHPFGGFTEVWRAPFVPNSCFGFWKTNNSWHAVEKICRKIRRDVLLFNIYEENAPKE